MTQRALSRIDLDCAAGSTAAYNTIRVFEQWSISNPAFADRDATAQVPPASLSPLQLPTSATPYFLRSSNLRELLRTPFRKNLALPARFWSSGDFVRRPPSCVLFFRRLQYTSFLDDFNTVWPSGDFYHNLHIFSSGLFLLGPYSPLQILFVMGAYCFLFPCSIFFCVY